MFNRFKRKGKEEKDEQKREERAGQVDQASPLPQSPTQQPGDALAAAQPPVEQKEGKKQGWGFGRWFKSEPESPEEARAKEENERKLDESVKRTKQSFFGRVTRVFDRRSIDEDLWDELEELLIEADVGVRTTDDLIARLRERVRSERISDPDDARAILKEEMEHLLEAKGNGHRPLIAPDRPLNVVMVVGVNGTGKTTSIAKLANFFRQSGIKVTLAAADTFRAAAEDQLKIWGERIGVAVVAHQPGSDPGAVVYDALQSSLSRGAQLLIIDTAGRLHTKFNLMEELKKIRRVVQKQIPDAPHEVLLVLDATTGQNALLQAKSFTEAVGVTGLILAKLDGSAKGGAVFAIAQELRLPIRFVGTGETPADLAVFDPKEFVEALFSQVE